MEEMAKRATISKPKEHLEQEAALLDPLVAGELLRHGVADAGEAPRRDHLGPERVELELAQVLPPRPPSQRPLLPLSSSSPNPSSP